MDSWTSTGASQSTRGHCILVLTAEFYVCDLAGTEPAGGIVFASYQKQVVPNTDPPEIEWIMEVLRATQGPIQGKKVTRSEKEKINLSLSEMAQFFLKMAQAVKSGKLKAGQSIPGCNTYFLTNLVQVFEGYHASS